MILYRYFAIVPMFDKINQNTGQDETKTTHIENYI